MGNIDVRRWAVRLGVLGFGVVMAAAIVLITAPKPDGDGPSEAMLGGLVGRFVVAPTPAPVPAFDFQDAKGQPVRLGDFSGRVVLLNLWATWCGPCVGEMPALDRLQASLGGRDFQVVALSQDRGGAGAVLPFLEQHHLQALTPYLDAPGAAAPALGSLGLPTTILIGRDGREVGRMLGAAAWDVPPARLLIEDLIAPPGPIPAEARP